MHHIGKCWLSLAMLSLGLSVSAYADNAANEQVQMESQVQTESHEQRQSTAQTQIESTGQTMYHDALSLHQKTPQDHKAILAAYAAAANAGSAEARYILAQSYYQGSLGLKKDNKKAQAYIDQAIAAGSAHAKILQAEIWLKAQTKEDRQKAIQILQPLEKDNLYAARHLLAMVYLDAVNSTESEIDQGLKLLQQNQRAGYVPSVEVVAWMFENGHLVAENLGLAKQLYEVLAKNQVPQMQRNIDRVQQKIKAREAEKKL